MACHVTMVTWILVAMQAWVVAIVLWHQSVQCEKGRKWEKEELCIFYQKILELDDWGINEMSYLFKWTWYVCYVIGWLWKLLCELHKSGFNFCHFWIFAILYCSILVYQNVPISVIYVLIMITICLKCSYNSYVWVVICSIYQDIPEFASHTV